MNEDVIGMLGTAGLLIVFIVLVFMGVLGFLLPLFVYLINGKLKKLNEQMDMLIKATGGSGTARVAGEALAESRVQSQLLRQLLRAYGHNPEV